jgi:hypothetical protein
MSAIPSEYSHDVFVSYSHKDKTWVASVLVKALRDNGLRVLVDESDFEPGKASIENMTDAILHSRRTLAVITPNWVGSEWTRFEGLVTAQEDPAGTRGRLLPILRVQCQPPKWLAIRTWLDFFDDAAVPRQIPKLVRMLTRPLETLEVVKAAPAEQALRTLPDLMREDSAVREALLEYRVRMESLVGRIDRIVALKAVHDHLHNIQFRCYDLILREAPRVADDVTAADSIESYAGELLGTIEKLRTLDEEPVFASSHLRWIATLRDAYDLLMAGAQARDAARIQQAAKQLDRMLRIQPVIINTRLFDAADGLELEAVSGAISFVCDRGSSEGMAAEKLAPLIEARDVIEQLDRNLAELVRSHDLWQEVDQNIRTLAPNLDDLSMVSEEWSLLKSDLETLSATPAEWAKNLRKELPAIDAAIAANDQPTLVRAFGRLRQAAGRRFYDVDRDLNDQCGELGEVGKPLAQIVEALA